MTDELSKLSREQRVTLLRGAYNALDGLWFMAVEKRFGNQVARELDLEVWRIWGGVLAKRLMDVLGLKPETPSSLGITLKTWLALEGWDFELNEQEQKGDDDFIFELTVSECPWWNIMLRSNRTDVVDCSEIDREFLGGIAHRFSPAWRVEMMCAKPRGNPECRFRFYHK